MSSNYLSEMASDIMTNDLLLESQRRSTQSQQLMSEPMRQEIDSLSADSTLVRDVAKLVATDQPLTASRRYKETEAFHKFIRSGRASSQANYGLSPLAFAYFVPIVFSVCVQKLRPKSVSEPVSSTDVDEQALVYVGGFFVRKLRSCKNLDATDLLDSWTRTEGTNDSWTALQDRGGLIHISEPLLAFLRCIETLCLQSIAGLADTNANLGDRLFNVLVADQSVRDRWETLTSPHDINSCSAEAIFVCLVSHFTQLRCQAYVSALRRHVSVAPTKPAHSLRQSLQ